MPAPEARRQYHYLALGDSYTIGESVSEDERWSVQLAQMLRTKGYDIRNPFTIAKTGWTTGELIEAVDKTFQQQSYDLVTLLIGVNNQYRGQPIETYREEFRQLLQTAIRNGRNDARRVIVLSIPDWGVTPFAAGQDRAKIAAEIDAFNAVARDETNKVGITFLDVTGMSRKALNDPTYVAEDKLHFSGKMYQEWAQLVFPVAENILK
ncbi:SGNH/GDSL hydrolase family protein [Adhaeribacter rhizoryzae]|uniref:SGNH/GDSL hydrolase family protein n=1 Tax=Adhaeribacter rhizoryzae TaxID=2607907 RepID=A0A5M6DVT6_9BACT|nr:SGNH/GDSL hydrolase family protein [Adhaeribacter rhizoryzae]KAA5549595.1 SGNH/GDSL hydrolase family protein [Adhaeribacter rhizoryzae]